MPRKLNNREEIYLIGPAVENIHFTRLPTKQDVLQLFFYQHNASQGTVREKAQKVAEKIIESWNRAKIPICRFQDIIDKITRLHTEWKRVKKNHLRKNSIRQRCKEDEFKTNISKLFNIIKPKATEILNAHQRIFLEGQCAETRRGFLPRQSSHKDTKHEIIEENHVDENGNTGELCDDGKLHNYSAGFFLWKSRDSGKFIMLFNPSLGTYLYFVFLQISVNLSVKASRVS